MEPGWRSQAVDEASGVYRFQKQDASSECHAVRSETGQVEEEVDKTGAYRRRPRKHGAQAHAA